MQIVKDVYSWLKTANIKKPKLITLKGLVREELKEFTDAIKLKDRKEQLNAIVDLLWVVNNLGYYHGFTEEEILEEHKKTYLSNQSKFCKTEEEAILSVQAYENGTHPNKYGIKLQTTYLKSGDLYIITLLNGKIMKSINFKDVNELEK